MRRTCSVARRLQRDGAVWPLPVLSAHDARAMRLRLGVELSGAKDFKRSDLLYYKSHLVFGVVDELARHPAIVAAAQDALGSRDLLLWDSSVPLKPAAAAGAAAAAERGRDGRSPVAVAGPRSIGRRVEEEAVRGRSSSLVEVTSSLGLRGGGGARGGSNREVEEPKPRPEPNLLAVVFAGE